MLAVIDVVIPVFLVVGFGYVAVWQGLFAQSGIDGLMSFAQNFGIPCLLFKAISTLDLSQGFDPWMLLSFLHRGNNGLCGRAVARAVSVWPRLGRLRCYRVLLSVFQFANDGSSDNRAGLWQRPANP